MLKVSDQLRVWIENTYSISGESAGYQKLLPDYPVTDEIAELKNYTQCVNVLCRNPREWEYWKPLLKKSEGKVVVWCECFIEDDYEFSCDILLIDIVSLKEKYICNPFLERIAGSIFRKANQYVLLFDTLCPACALILTGCNPEGELLSAFCKYRDIPSVCVQQGWPSLMHTKFRNMEYDYFLTWGEGFNSIWEEYNPGVHFISAGYPYPVYKEKKDPVITFFLQHPVITLDSIYEDEMLELIRYCSETFPDRVIWVREHPAIPLAKKGKEYLGKMQNLVFVSDLPVEQIFVRTEVAVSYFSSILIESLLYGAIPFIFDPSSTPGYYPDLARESCAVEAKSLGKQKKKSIG